MGESIKKYNGYITVTLKTCCQGKNGIDAKDDLEERAGFIKDYIECAKSEALEVVGLDVEVGEIEGSEDLSDYQF